MKRNPIAVAIDLVGLGMLARLLGLNNYQTLWCWKLQGRLPRSAWTGEKDYAEVIEAATLGCVTREELLKSRS